MARRYFDDDARVSKNASLAKRILLRKSDDNENEDNKSAIFPADENKRILPKTIDNFETLPADRDRPFSKKTI